LILYLFVVLPPAGQLQHLVQVAADRHTSTE